MPQPLLGQTQHKNQIHMPHPLLRQAQHKKGSEFDF